MEIVHRKIHHLSSPWEINLIKRLPFCVKVYPYIAMVLCTLAHKFHKVTCLSNRLIKADRLVCPRVWRRA